MMGQMSKFPNPDMIVLYSSTHHMRTKEINMFEQLVAPENVIAMRLSGTLTREDVHTYKAIIEDKIASHKHFGVCVDMSKLHDLGADALTDDAMVEFELLTHVSKFRRCALVSDKSWPITMAVAIGHLIPLLEVKSFEPEQGDAAIVWASEGPAQPH